MAFSLVLPYFADILPPSAVFRHTVRLLPVFIFSTVLPGYMSEYSVMVSPLNSTIGGVAEAIGVAQRTVVVLCRDTRKRVLDANIPGNRTALCRCHDAESACDDRSNYGDDERSCKFACIIFIFYS